MGQFSVIISRNPGSALSANQQPPYSPDFKPIEMAFSKLKALLRKAAARTIDELWSVVAACLQAFKPDECVNYFEAAGYDPE
jgi:transposase